ncbi:MAG: iron-sulfur cluster assembly scaffold protein [Polymorphobacter sp.]
MSETLYNTQILRLAASTAGAVRLAAPQASAVKVSPVCGSKVTADIDLGADGRVSAFGMEVRACALGQAAAALVAADIVGKTPDDLVTARAELADWLGGRCGDAPVWPGMAVFDPARPHRARHPSILLTFDAAIAAAAAVSESPAAVPATAA